MTDALVVWCPPDPQAVRHRLVTPRDIERAARFRLTVDAHRHLTGRVLARRAGASWLGMDPLDVHVEVEPGGRPVLVEASGTRLGAHVSITHAGSVVGVAVAGSPVGLDAQDVGALQGLLCSRDIWTATELNDLARADPAGRLRTAAEWWTAKEAVLKSLGRGLLDPVEHLEIRDSPIPWTSLDTGDEHASAIAGSVPARVVHLGCVNDAVDP